MIPRPKDSYAVGADRVAPDLATLVAFIRPAWHRRAACRGTMLNGHSDWFPDPHKEDPNLAAARALAVCEACPVRAECGAAGTNEFGIWGRVTHHQRLDVRKIERRRLAYRAAAKRGKWLRERREDAGMSQELLAVLMCVNQGTVSRWEAGATNPPARYRTTYAFLLRFAVEEVWPTDEDATAC